METVVGLTAIAVALLIGLGALGTAIGFGLFIVAGVALMLLAHGQQPLLLVVAIVGASTLGPQILLYTYAAQFYPTSICSTGVGFFSGLGRVGAAGVIPAYAHQGRGLSAVAGPGLAG